MNLLAPFAEKAGNFGNRIAIAEAGGTTISFEALLARSARIAAAWRQRSIGKGDRVLIAMPLGIDLYVCLAALWRLGAVVVLPEPALGLPGLRHAARAAKPKAVLATGWFRALPALVPELWGVRQVLSPQDQAEGSDELAAMQPADPALVSFTSGSTGTPKGILRSHGFLAAQNACVAGLLQPEAAPKTDLVAFPVFVIANLALGNTSVLPCWNLRRPDTASGKAILNQMRQRRVTRALLPPSICEVLADRAEPLPLEAIFTGGGPVFPDLIERLQRIGPAIDLVSVYGSTEAEPIAHLHARDISAADWQTMKTGAGLLTGKPIAALRLRITGREILVTGSHVNLGYLDPAQDASTKASLDGCLWHRTGDAGRLDKDGRLWLLGRLSGRCDDLFPFCVEAAARFWPGVRRAALIGHGGNAVLAVEGDSTRRAQWQKMADGLGRLKVVPLRAIPLDRRHRSKVDYVALDQLLRAGGKDAAL